MRMFFVAAAIVATLPVPANAAPAVKGVPKCERGFVQAWKNWNWKRKTEGVMPTPKRRCVMGTYICDASGCGRE